MNSVQAFILGVIQGLTEFLPISSSGHLVITQSLFGLVQPGIAFEVSVHLGTLAAVVIFFRRDILAVIAAAVIGCRRLIAREASLHSLFAEERGFRMAVLLAAGSVPTAIIGVLFQAVSEQLFSSVVLAGSMLIVTGLILVLTRVLLGTTGRVAEERIRGMSDLTLRIALIIGVVQGLAVIPGISRSGSTIAAGLFLGLDRKTAGTFSFLLSIPAIVGAAGLQVVLASLEKIQFLPVLVGLTTSFVVGFLSLGFLMRILGRGRLYLFAPYCLLVGMLALFFSL